MKGVIVANKCVPLISQWKSIGAKTCNVKKIRHICVYISSELVTDVEIKSSGAIRDD